MILEIIDPFKIYKLRKHKIEIEHNLIKLNAKERILCINKIESISHNVIRRLFCLLKISRVGDNE